MKHMIAPLIALTMLGSVSSTPAVATPFYSGSGSATCELNAAVFGSADCTLQAIDAHGAWQQPGIGNLNGSQAEWVSYANTGVGNGAVLAPIPDDTTPTPEILGSVPWILKVTEEFIIGSGGGGLDVKFWADDTADVYLNGVLKKGATFTQNICAGAAIGCEPNEFFQLAETLDPGAYYLDIYVYQTGNGNQAGGNPFGLIYGGEIRGLSERVPAPAAGLLFAAGLMGLGMARRKSRHA